ncbi:Mob1 family protein [Phyllosticta citribraziliensis]|uniref:Mob1 family protein n=1 Tax=Phyllosticta citribraziliensis TaxID=989973 RepID=A0ABR1LX88_9PEZI
MTAMSPSSSPRLPSPPPIAEDQSGPKSPASDEHESTVDQGASRRIRPGTRAADMAEGPPLADLKDIESAFQLQEYLKALHYAATHPPDADSSNALDRPSAIRLATPPEGIDRALWLYELCRFLTQHSNSILIALFADEPPCSAQTCPEMRASEWQYLCAVHDPPKSCCAIDYCCHTLDWAANTLTSPKSFPSRLALGTETGSAHQQIRQLTNIFRRVYRIYAHAWFQHRDMFWKVENKTGLYQLFKVVCDTYSLIQNDNYTIPPEAEGIEAPTPTEPLPSPVPTILKKNGDEGAKGRESDAAGSATVVTGNTTKRHRHTASSSAHSVSTVIEEKEEEEEPKSKGESADDSFPESGESIKSEVLAEKEDEEPSNPATSSESEPAQETQVETDVPSVDITEITPDSPTTILSHDAKPDKKEAGEAKEEEPEAAKPAEAKPATEADEEKKDEDATEQPTAAAAADAEPTTESEPKASAKSGDDDDDVVDAPTADAATTAEPAKTED